MAGHLVDVVIPVFNAERTVFSAIESIQRQTLAEIRIIAVDDGSTDATPRLLRDIAAGDRRVQVVTQANSGIVDALNAALAHCTAPFVARHDADDLAYPNRLAAQVAYLERNQDCVAVSCAVRHIDESDRDLGTVARLSSPEAADPTLAPSKEPYLIHPFLTVRREALDMVGGYRHVVHAEDTDLYWRLQELGRLHNMDDVLGDYRMHSGSISGSSIQNGRVMAISSQLAAISSVRRRSNRPDLQFSKEAAARLRSAGGSLGNLFETAAEALESHESDYLKIAVAGKLLELAAYRPYELELADCVFIRSALDERMHSLPGPNRSHLHKVCAGTMARLLHKGLVREAFALTPPSQYASGVARLALRVALPAEIRTRLKTALGREVLSK